MKSRRPRAAFALLLLLSCCSSSAGAPTGQSDPSSAPDISDVIYVGGPTDEALLRLLDATAKNDLRQTVILDSPDSAAPVPKESPATVTFHSASSASRAPAPRLGPTAEPRSLWQRSLHEVVQLLSPERVAHAHGTPYNGTAYYLLFSGADSKQILQVFTAATSFTPEAVDWQHLTAAAQPLTLQITSATFDENTISSNGGPFVGGKFYFRIQ